MISIAWQKIILYTEWQEKFRPTENGAEKDKHPYYTVGHNLRPKKILSNFRVIS